MYKTDQGNYDIIGDTHGHVIELEKLLKKLGYAKCEEGYYAHHSRKVIFLGDFVDGGTQHKALINIVKPMVENKAAYAIMGNHEFNAISFHTLSPESKQPLRARTIKNIGQHIEFLAEYKKDEVEMLSVIEWFKTLPLFIDLSQVRAIHACWSEYEISKIKPFLTRENTIKPHLIADFFVQANIQGSPEYSAVEILLKGLELPMPKGFSFKDKTGAQRHNIRVKWWLRDGLTYQDYALVPPDVTIPDIPFDHGKIKNYTYSANDKPVFVGHYWLTGTPKIQASNIACLDYSVGKTNNQVAYQWHNNDTTLRNTHFVCSSS